MWLGLKQQCHAQLEVALGTPMDTAALDRQDRRLWLLPGECCNDVALQSVHKRAMIRAQSLQRAQCPARPDAQYMQSMVHQQTCQAIRQVS